MASRIWSPCVIERYGSSCIGAESVERDIGAVAGLL